jgi:hypothetical protein
MSTDANKMEEIEQSINQSFLSSRPFQLLSCFIEEVSPQSIAPHSGLRQL